MPSGPRDLAPSLSAVRAGMVRRPKGFWKRMYIEMQERDHPENAKQQFQFKDGVRRGSGDTRKAPGASNKVLDPSYEDAEDEQPEPFTGSLVDTLHPPSAPGLFGRDWLRSLLCAGCGLAATTSVVECIHCNLVVHSWCRDLCPRSQIDTSCGGRGSGSRRSSHQGTTGHPDRKSQSCESVSEWVCWECEDDMVKAMQYYKTLKRRQVGQHMKKPAAEKIIRFISRVAKDKRAIKDRARIIVIQSYIRMQMVFLPFKRWGRSQKRPIIVAVRSASGLPVGDPFAHKDNPYVVISVVEPSGDAAHGQRGVQQTFVHQLHVKGGDKAPVRPGGGGRREKDTENTIKAFQWDEEYFLPGVSDSATIVFTVLQEAPTRTICLGQALTSLKTSSKFGEHVREVGLGKQRVAVRLRDCQRRIDDVAREKRGNVTFLIRKSSRCDAYCAGVFGPTGDEIRSLALVDSRGREVGQGETASREGAGARVGAEAALDAQNTKSRDERLSVCASGGDGATVGDENDGDGDDTGGGSTEGRVGTDNAHLTSWWACMWLGRLRLYQNFGDPCPMLNLRLEGWSALPDEQGSKATKPELRLVDASATRWLVLRCPTMADLGRWKDVLEMNHLDVVTRRHGDAHSNRLHDADPNNLSPTVAA